MDNLANLSFLEALKIVWPLLVVQVGLQIYCVTKVIKQGVRSLSKKIWLFITVFGGYIGVFSFLLFGIRKDY
jgi:hypothetical protein